MSQEDANRMVEVARTVVTHLISKLGKFLVHAVYFTPDMETYTIDWSLVEDGSTVIDQFHAVVRKELKNGRAIAIITMADVEITEPDTEKDTRAARVELEHRDMDPVTWYYPYELIAGEWKFGGATGDGYFQDGKGLFFGGRR
ncbi:MAG: hypothetical protein K8T89_05070 [Planctomycetes bacterium]|nr:hypothetical protein [Planctomycetota bacterium]